MTTTSRSPSLQLQPRGRRMRARIVGVACTLTIFAAGCDNATLESLARLSVQEMRGVVWMPAGVPACPAPRSCGGDDKNHHGVMYHVDCGYVGRGTVCISGGLSQGDAHRGSDFVHEAMHLYLLRLEDKGILPWYRLGYPSMNIVFNNEKLTDCLARASGAVITHTQCPAHLKPIADQLIREFSPYNNPRWYY